MLMNQKTFTIQTLQGDLFGGLTAAVIALPLALAFGVSSGVGAIAGVYGAILVGFFAALFGGTPAQVSGPTGPMTVVMATIVLGYSQTNPDSALALAFTVVVMAGLIQILFGVFRLGKYITLVPYPVISGFMTGIGIIIIVLQLGPLFGYESSPDVLQTLQQIPYYINNPYWPSVIFTFATLIIVRFWPARMNDSSRKPFPRSSSLIRKSRGRGLPKRRREPRSWTSLSRKCPGPPRGARLPWDEPTVSRNWCSKSRAGA